MDTITFQDMEKTYKDMFKIRQKFNSTNTYRVPTMCQALFWAFWGYNKELSLVTQLCPTLCNPMDCRAHQAPLSMGFSRQEYWDGLPFPSPGDLPDPGIKSTSPVSPVSSALQEDSLPLVPPGSPR